MARRNSGKGTDEAQTTAPAEENTEATQTEAPAEEAPVNLDGFKTAVAEALTKADKSTGELPAEAQEPVNAAYRELDGNKPKAAARSYLEEQMLEAVGKLDPTGARSYADLRANLSAGGGSSATKTPADPTQAFVQRVAALQIAYGIVTGNVPEKVSEDWTAQVEKLVGELQGEVTSYQQWATAEVPEGEERPEAPTVSPVVRSAFKLSAGKASGGRASGGGSGVRRDIGKHITEAFASVEAGGFLSVAEIAKFKSTEYGDDSPSQGAISARLFPESGKMSVEGIEAVESKAIDGKNPKGARKVA